MLSKLTTLHADTICLDLEDGVSHSAKSTARLNINQTLTQHSKHFFLHTPSTTTPPSTTAQSVTQRRPELLVRINPAGSSECAADLRALLECAVLPHGVVLPKLESVDQLQHVYNTLRQHHSLQQQQQRQSIALIALVETARGLLDLHSTLTATTAAHFPLQSLIFGGDDYCADIGATRTADNTELLTARQLVILHTTAHHLQALDIVHIDIHNTTALIAECNQSYSFGYTGKQCIHPKQVEILEQQYVGGSERVEWSKRVVEGWAENERVGVGAWTLDGKMIDLPTVKNAQKVLAHARACGVDI